jgi:hypothetical protein
MKNASFTLKYGILQSVDNTHVNVILMTHVPGIGYKPMVASLLHSMIKWAGSLRLAIAHYYPNSKIAEYRQLDDYPAYAQLVDAQG